MFPAYNYAVYAVSSYLFCNIRFSFLFLNYLKLGLHNSNHSPISIIVYFFLHYNCNSSVQFKMYFPMIKLHISNYSSIEAL